MRRSVAAVVVLLLAGCGQQERAPRAPIDSEQLNAIASSGPTVAETLAAGNDALPAKPAPTGFSYQGTWAPTAEACRSEPWRFAYDQVTIAGETRCTAPKPDARTDSEVKLGLSCTALAGKGLHLATNETWSLVKREDGSMIVARTAGNSIPRSTTLRRCA